MRVGSGALTFELIEDWEQLPPGLSHPDVAAVSVDSRGRVYLFCRGADPVFVYETDGALIETWGHGGFVHPHGMYVSGDDELFLVDDVAHSVAVYSLRGQLLRSVGPAGVASDTGYQPGDFDGMSVERPGPPYNRPTNVAQLGSGDLLVADGYGNCRVHRFTQAGTLVDSWGDPGSGAGQFRLVHDLAVHPDGRVLVADSTNDRIQLFDSDGIYLDSWLDVQRPRGVHVDVDGLVYVSELAWPKGSVSARRGRVTHGEPSRMSIFDADGCLMLRWGEGSGSDPGQFVAPHGIWVDRDGSLYVGEVTQTIGVDFGLVPAGTHTLQKFGRL